MAPAQGWHAQIEKCKQFFALPTNQLLICFLVWNFSNCGNCQSQVRSFRSAHWTGLGKLYLLQHFIFIHLTAGKGCAFLSSKWKLVGEVYVLSSCPSGHVDGLPWPSGHSTRAAQRKLWCPGWWWHGHRLRLATEQAKPCGVLSGGKVSLSGRQWPLVQGRLCNYQPFFSLWYISHK